MRQLSLKLPEEMWQRLQELAGQTGNTVGEEIRRRLEASFEADEERRRDPALAEFQRLTGELAQMVELDRGWRERFGFDIFAAGVAALLERWCPPPAASRRVSVHDPERDDPATVALTYLRLLTLKE
jgi:hypothetical protein